jgi:hypothetical protein
MRGRGRVTLLTNVADPVVLRVVRPYASDADLLGAEGWTITMKRIVLIGARPLKRGTIVQVELVLKTGEKVLRAEGKVIGMAKARSDRPKGLEVRLKRYGAATKRFLERAAQAAKEEESQTPAEESPPRSAPEVDSPAESNEIASSPSHSLAPEADDEDAEAELVSQVENELVSQVDVLDDEPITDVDVLGHENAAAGDATSPDSDLSGVRVRVVEPPADREALLERLRERARRIAGSKES